MGLWAAVSALSAALFLAQALLRLLLGLQLLQLGKLLQWLLQLLLGGGFEDQDGSAGGWQLLMVCGF